MINYINLNIIFFKNSLPNFKLLTKEFIVRKVYSDLSFSKILFLFCVTRLTEVQVLIIISNDFTGLEILVSPKGIEIIFFT